MLSRIRARHCADTGPCATASFFARRTFDPAAFAAFRDLPLAAAAGSWAATGALGPLQLLQQHYPASMAGAVLLGVLSRIPETVNPRLYGGLLPKVSA